MGTINTMNYLFAAYAAIWIILAIYLFSIHTRQKKLQAEIQNLRQLLERQPPGKRQ